MEDRMIFAKKKRLLQNDDNERFVIPGERSATRNQQCFRYFRFRGNDGKSLLFHFAKDTRQFLFPERGHDLICDLHVAVER
ncbi:MAG: hypothetical protein ACOY3O_00145 [Thermodesulfobacteriota bacterium]